MKKNAIFWTHFNIVENHYINIFFKIIFLLIKHVIEYIFIFFVVKKMFNIYIFYFYFHKLKKNTKFVYKYFNINILIVYYISLIL